ncbi:MAG TPA: prepilin-type N-terminal cleavage/methylation domain-containing protein [Opitutus sp.]|nr:prepilin-type N-terminal cleavage/methylation domain-containing protein [Opitutus sp.]
MNPARRCGRGFTLIELLVVIALIATMSAFLVGGLRGNKTARLQTAQATIANLITAARTRAAASGCRVRLLINADAANSARFRRMIAMQQETSYKADDWTTTVTVVTLPEGIIVLPYKDRIPTGLYANSGDWTKTAAGSGSSQLQSSSLWATPVTIAVQMTAAEDWDVIQFTPNNTMTYGTGDLVLATASVRPPGSYMPGESPARAESPDTVRGITISTYGVPSLINSRSGF